MKTPSPFFILGCLLATSILATADDTIVKSGPRSNMSLTGTWQTLPVPGFQFTFPPPQSGWKDTPIPEQTSTNINSIGGPYTPAIKELLNSQSTGFKQSDKMAAWYRRSFKLPDLNLSGQRAVLHFQERNLGQWQQSW
jgi:hypothetical protein